MAHRKRKPAEGGAGVDEEAAFPRGGAGALSAVEKRKIQLAAKADFDKEGDAQPAAKRPRKGKGSAGPKAAEAPDEDAAFLAKELSGDSIKYVETLTYGRVAEGARVWGVVMEVAQDFLTVSLPHGLRGRVAPEDASDVLALLLKTGSKKGAALRKALGRAVPTLPELFYVGQFVRGCIVDLDEEAAARRKTVPLSLKVGLLNADLPAGLLAKGMHVPACVQSVEDHGYVLSLGIKGSSAFLQKAAYQEAYGPDAALLPGGLVDIVLTKKAPGSSTASTVWTASASPKDVAGAVTKEWPGVTITSILPGALVNAKVQRQLPDGLALSFLTYFSGTVDRFHMGSELLGAGDEWKAAYAKGVKLRARVVYVDPSAKKVYCSLLRHLVGYHMPDAPPMLGQIFEAATVRRVDKNFGALLELPTQPVPQGGYVHAANAREPTDPKLEKVLKPGAKVRARVIGFRPMDGLATLSLRKAAMEQQVLAFSDVAVGAVLSGTVAAAAEGGMTIAISPSIRALVPPAHMSDAGSLRAALKKYKVGSKVQARVLHVDAGKRKIVMTLRKGLVASKYPTPASFEAVAPGSKVAGIVTRVEDYGLHVELFGRLRALLPLKHLALEPGQSPAAAYNAGDVLKARVLSVTPAKKRITLTLSSAAAAAGADAPRWPPPPGTLLRARVTGAVLANGPREKAPAADDDDSDAGDEEVTAYRVALSAWPPSDADPDGARALGEGRVPIAHLADAAAAAKQTKLALGGDEEPALAAGADLGCVVVLQGTTVSRKASLVDAARAARLPSSIDALVPGAAAPGYVASVTRDAVYVRFLDRLTGRAGLPQLADTFVADPAARFAVGQSVRAQVLSVDAGRGQFSLNLKPSALGAAPDGAALASLLRELRAAAQLKCEQDPEEAALDLSRLPLGAVAAGVVERVEDYGVIVDLDACPEAIGLIPTESLAPGAPPPAPGARVSAVVLDVDAVGGIVLLSAKPALLAAARGDGKKKGTAAKGLSKLVVGSTVDAVVEAILEHGYVVLSLPSAGHALGAAALWKVNTPPARLEERLSAGASVRARVVDVATVEPDARARETLAGRAMLEIVGDLEATTQRKDKKGGGAKRSEGDVLSGSVTHVHALHADIALDDGGTGRLHVTCREKTDDGGPPPLKVGDAVEAVVLGLVDTTAGRSHGVVELCTLPAAVSAAKAGKALPSEARPLETKALKPGRKVVGYVQEVGSDAAWVALSPSLRGRLHVFDASDDPEVLASFARRFRVGSRVDATVLAAAGGKKKAKVDLGCAGPKITSSIATLAAGQLRMGRIASVSGSDVLVQASGSRSAKVALTDVSDAFAPSALATLAAGQPVRLRVLSAGDPGKGRGGWATASLRPSDGGLCKAAFVSLDGEPSPSTLDRDKLEEGGPSLGYIKHVSGSGAFVCLARNLDARIKLSNLAAKYIDDPKEEFPVGTLVNGTIVKVTAAGVEMSLRPRRAAELADLAPGDTVKGVVSRIEKYGAFVALDKGDVTGLAHVSQLSDEHVKDPRSVVKIGQAVRAKVLSVENGRLGLGLKRSLFEGEEDEDADADGADVDADEDLDDALMADAPTLGSDDESGGASSDEDDGADASDEARDGSDEDGDEAGADEDGDEDDADLDGALVDAAENADASASEEDEDDLIDEPTPGSKVRGAAERDVDDDEMLSGTESDVEESDEDDDAEEEEGSGDSSEEDSEDSGDGGPGEGLSSGWGALAINPGGAAADEAADVEDEGGKASKRAKKRAKAEREAEIRAKEMEMLEGDAAPKSTADFERAVLSSPNSSFVWIKYMAHLLQAAETDKARALAERALGTIHFREESEQFNVWAAWLNLELRYAPEPDAAFAALLRRALPHCSDPKKLYLAALDILERAGKAGAAADLLGTALKKFGHSCKVWVRAYEGRLAGARDGGDGGAGKLLPRALQALPKRKHVKLLSRAALAEFKRGSAERGRGVLEGLLRAHPKRLDLWLLYLDQEGSDRGDVARARALYERATHGALKVHAMKVLFKRYHAFETAHGDDARVDHVKRRAMDYVASL